jgi:predicted nucleic acid-binding protein
MPAEHFVDTNVLVYLLSADDEKAEASARLLGSNAVISVQVLNELANVARRKCGLDWSELDEFMAGIRRVCRIVPLTVETHEQGLSLAQQYQLSIYDALIVAATRQSGCGTLYSEDLQHGMRFGSLRVSNPFR